MRTFSDKKWKKVMRPACFLPYYNLNDIKNYYFANLLKKKTKVIYIELMIISKFSVEIVTKKLHNNSGL